MALLWLTISGCRKVTWKPPSLGTRRRNDLGGSNPPILTNLALARKHPVRDSVVNHCFDSPAGRGGSGRYLISKIMEVLVILGGSNHMY